MSEPRWPEKLPEVGIPADEASSMGERLLSIILTGVVALGSVGLGGGHMGFTEARVRGAYFGETVGDGRNIDVVHRESWYI